MATAKLQITKAKAFNNIEEFIKTSSNKYSIKKVLLGDRADLFEDIEREITPRLSRRGQVYAALITITVLPMGEYFKNKDMILDWAETNKSFFEDYFKSNLKYVDVRFGVQHTNAKIMMVVIPITQNGKLSFGALLNGTNMKNFKDSYNALMKEKYDFEIVEDLGKNALKQRLTKALMENKALKAELELLKSKVS